MRVKVQLTEMKSAEAQYVSLVARGANRIPFRVIKSADEEKNMIDLTKPSLIFKAAKKPENQAPTVSAVVVSSEVAQSEQLEAIKAALVESGLTVEKSETQEDGTIMFSQVENPTEDAELVRLNENMLLVVKGFKPYCENLKGFNQIVQVEGYHSGVSAATSAFHVAMGQALRDAESPAVAAQKADEIATQFKTYVTSLVQSLPEVAFKAEKAVDAILDAGLTQKAAEGTEEKIETGAEEVEKGAGLACPEGVEKGKWDAMTDEEKKSYKPAKKEDGTDEGKEGESTITDEEKVVRKTADVVMSALKGELETMFAPLADFGNQIKALAARVEEVAVQAAETAKKADEVKGVVNTTIVATAGSGDRPANEGNVVTKGANEDPRSGCFDTAFIRRK